MSPVSWCNRTQSTWYTHIVYNSKDSFELRLPLSNNGTWLRYMHAVADVCFSPCVYFHNTGHSSIHLAPFIHCLNATPSHIVSPYPLSNSNSFIGSFVICILTGRLLQLPPPFFHTPFIHPSWHVTASLTDKPTPHPNAAATRISNTHTCMT